MVLWYCILFAPRAVYLIGIWHDANVPCTKIPIKYRCSTLQDANGYSIERWTAGSPTSSPAKQVSWATDPN